MAATTKKAATAARAKGGAKAMTSRGAVWKTTTKKAGTRGG